MADVPSAVQYGRVVGRFVSFVADSNDVGNVPDEVPLTGTVTITANTPLIKFVSTSPPRTAVIATLECPVINGDLCAPGTTTPGVYMIASDQPQGSPNHVQFTARFNFLDVSAQPTSVVFEVPVGGEIDLAMTMGVNPNPGTVVVISTEGVARVEEIYGEINDIIDGGGIIMGDDGREVELQSNGIYIQWRYVGDASWINLVTLEDLRGPTGLPGDDGAKGDDGTDGREVSFRISGGYIQWQYVGGSTWTNLVDLASITGPAGAAGDVLTMGTVSTGAAGSSASATISGTSPNKTLSLTIPRGDTGASGAGLATGGSKGQVPFKNSATNFDTLWGNGGSVATSPIVAASQQNAPAASETTVAQATLADAPAGGYFIVAEVNAYSTGVLAGAARIYANGTKIFDGRNDTFGTGITQTHPATHTHPGGDLTVIVTYQPTGGDTFWNPRGCAVAFARSL